MSRPHDRFRAAPHHKPLPDGSPAFRVERRSDADRKWHSDSGSMSQAAAERLAHVGNDPLGYRR